MVIAHYEVAIRKLERTPVLFVHKEVPLTGIPAALGEAYNAVFAYAASRGVHPSGAPYARYFTVSPEKVVLDAGIPLLGPLAGEGVVESGVLPAGEAAVTTHIGRYEEMEPAYAAMRAWMRANGRQEAGAPWEIYLSDPQQEPDPATWRTEVVWPLL
jgi:effector-binding domain-containing protein